MPKESQLVVQGEFAGDNIVPPEKRIDKLNGLRTSTAFNLDGDVKSTLIVLQDRTAIELYFDKQTKEWGSRIVENPNVKIIVDYNHIKFLNTSLFAY